MTSDRAALPLLVALAACGSQVHDLSVATHPLVVIRGHVDLATLPRTRPTAPLIGALIWAAVPRAHPVCLKYSDPGIRPACPDPYGVSYGSIERAVRIDPDGSFRLELFHLPRAAVSVGDAMTRIAYGSLLVAEDLNGDGELSFASSAGTGPGGRGEGGPNGSQDPSPPAPDPDVPVAASLHNLRAPQRRIVFREGGFVADSRFYPAPGCDAPPQGFSVMFAPPYSEGPLATGACRFSSLEDPVEVSPLSEADARTLVCNPLQRSDIRPPPDDRPPGKKTTQVCLEPGMLAVVTQGVCPRLTVYTLKGCRNDPACEKTDWDVTDAKPAWWPCS
jgi:hypothetical protein